MARETRIMRALTALNSFEFACSAEEVLEQAVCKRDTHNRGHSLPNGLAPCLLELLVLVVFIPSGSVVH